MTRIFQFLLQTTRASCIAITLRMSRSLAALSLGWAIGLLVGVDALAAPPALSLVKSGTAAVAGDAIVAGTASYVIDLRVNTGGNAVSGLQYHIQSMPGETTTYGSSPLTALSAPFQPSEMLLSPSPGALVNQAAGTTIFFKESSGDYPAFANSAIASHQLNTRNLAPGSYVFTAVGQEFTNSSTTMTTFGAPASFTITVLADSDQDGMPDAFETANNLNPSESTDAARDEDGDGATNLREFQAGTNPRNPASVLRITNLERGANSTQISFFATANKVYQVEVRDSLSPETNWTVLVTNVTRTTDGVVQVADENVEGIVKRFYRAGVMR